MASPLTPSLSALERRLGVPEGALTDEDKARAEEALEDASTLVSAEIPAMIADRWAASAPKVAILVVLKAARREFENPRGVNQETLGEHTVGLSESSGVYLTAREIAQVRRAATGRSGGFTGSVRTPSSYASPPPRFFPEVVPT